MNIVEEEKLDICVAGAEGGVEAFCDGGNEQAVPVLSL